MQTGSNSVRLDIKMRLYKCEMKYVRREGFTLCSDGNMRTNFTPYRVFNVVNVEMDASNARTVPVTVRLFSAETTQRARTVYTNKVCD